MLAGIGVVKVEYRKILRDPNIVLCAELAEPKGGISVGDYGSGKRTVPEPLQKIFLHQGGSGSLSRLLRDRGFSGSTGTI